MARATELRQFERDYQAAWGQFGSGLSLGNPYTNARNPFRRAFLDRADPNDVAGDDPAADESGDPGDPSTGVTPPEAPNPPPNHRPPLPPAGPIPCLRRHVRPRCGPEAASSPRTPRSTSSSWATTAQAEAPSASTGAAGTRGTSSTWKTAAPFHRPQS